jgi:hypothetical protein
LRRSLLELEAVHRGCKPSTLLFLTPEDVVDASIYLRSLALRSVVVSRRNPSPYFQIALTERVRLRAKVQVRIYVASRACDARAVAESNEKGDYSGTGMLLGYPDCCVAAAAARDRIFRDPLFGVDRQSNLVDAAIRASTDLNYACNILLRDSAVCQWGPASLISHYPCSFQCHQTMKLAQAHYEVLASKWPLWGLQLVELLRSPMVFWSDQLWPPQFWDEMAGIAQLGGMANLETNCISEGCSMPTGHGRTPGGTFPVGASEIEITKTETVFNLDNGKQAISHAAAGSPALLDWRSGKIRLDTEF